MNKERERESLFLHVHLLPMLLTTISIYRPCGEHFMFSESDSCILQTCLISSVIDATLSLGPMF